MRHNNSYLILSGALCATLALLYLLFSNDHPLSYFLSVLLSLVICIPFITGFKRKTIDFFEPIYFISILYLINFSIRAFYILWCPEDFYIAHYGAVQGIEYRVFDLTLGFTILGFIMLLTGYYSQLSSSIAKALPKISILRESIERIGLEKILLIYLVGLLFRCLLFLQSAAVAGHSIEANTAFASISRLLGNFCFYGLALLSIRLFSNTKITKFQMTLLTLILIIELFFGYLGGYKSCIVPLFFVIAISYHYVRKRLHIKQILLTGFIGSTIIIFINFPLISSYRSGIVGKTNLTYKEAFSSMDEAFKNYDSIITPETTYRRFLNRLIGLDSFTMIVENVPSIHEYKYGGTFTIYFYNLFRKFLSPEIPDINVGRQFAIEFWGSSLWNPFAIAPMDIGEFYWNFGLVGMILGMFFLGIIYKLTYLYFMKCTQTSQTGVLFYIFAFLIFIGIEGSITYKFSCLLRQFILLLLITYLLKIRVIFNRKYAK